MRRAFECALSGESARFLQMQSRLRVLFCLPLRLPCLAGKGLQGLFISGKKLPFVEARYAIKASSIARKWSGRLVVAIGVQWCCYFTPPRDNSRASVLYRFDGISTKSCVTIIFECP